MVADSILAVARRFLFVRESEGDNHGIFVEWFLRLAGGKPGDPWCAAFATVILAMVFRGHSPLKLTTSTHDLLAECRAKGFIVETPQPGDLVFSMNAQGPHHVAFVTTATPDLAAIAGNTSEDGKSSNGTGVFEHGISSDDKVYARVS